ncbi:unnamed protein product [Cyclocybe aegerita]|uniref:Uncharacterized protein n=1 Tax=Cyclocybe aegerita TaxID=1973307 RepID=A0A8S0XSG0_CYCAE|nr:unnamed protein product [Cyclocybe aegerita]
MNITSPPYPFPTRGTRIDGPHFLAIHRDILPSSLVEGCDAPDVSFTAFPHRSHFLGERTPEIWVPLFLHNLYDLLVEAGHREDDLVQKEEEEMSRNESGFNFINRASPLDVSDLWSSNDGAGVPTWRGRGCTAHLPRREVPVDQWLFASLGCNFTGILQYDLNFKGVYVDFKPTRYT